MKIEIKLLLKVEEDETELRGKALLDEVKKGVLEVIQSEGDIWELEEIKFREED